MIVRVHFAKHPDWPNDDWDRKPVLYDQSMIDDGMFHEDIQPKKWFTCRVSRVERIDL